MIIVYPEGHILPVEVNQVPAKRDTGYIAAALLAEQPFSVSYTLHNITVKLTSKMHLTVRQDEEGEYPAQYYGIAALIPDDVICEVREVRS